MKLNTEQKLGIERLCESFHVDKLYLFGSALTAEFNENSDYDFLVKFRGIGLPEYFNNFLTFKEKLRDLLGRDVDLVEEHTLKNPILIDSINENRELIYAKGNKDFTPL